MVVGAHSSKWRAHVAGTSDRSRWRRLQVGAVLAAFLASATLDMLPTGSSSVVSAAATTSTTIPGPVIPLAQFPVQGKCTFTDTYGAPRSVGACTRAST